jgi:iron-sulfur cluster repair protein YtfE (RIC family)
VETTSASARREEPLSVLLEHDHREIDDPVQACADGTAVGVEARANLKRAMDELRRHIYAEEELLFPSLRQAGMTGPIMVMLREHGQMWPILDTLDRELAGGGRDDELASACRELIALLGQHNPKEEQILYPQVDRVVDDNASRAVRDFLDAGHVPADWVCQHLRAQQGDR